MPTSKNLTKLLEQPLSGMSFLIPSWNQAELLEKCLENLFQQLGKEAKDLPFEIIVIDNASSDDTEKVLQIFQKKHPLRVIKNQQNLGFARAINQAAAIASYPYLFLLNNDIFVQPGFLTALQQADQQLRRQKKYYFSLSSQIFFFDPQKRREESGRTFMQIRKGKIYLAHCLAKENLEGIQVTLYPGGGSSLVNREVFLALGGFDEELCQPMYAEDLALGVLSWQAHLPNYYVADSKVIHLHRGSSQSRFRNVDQMLATNTLAVCLTYNRRLFSRTSLLLFAVWNQILHPKTAASLPQLLFRLPAILKTRKKAQSLGASLDQQLLQDFIAWTEKRKLL